MGNQQIMMIASMSILLLTACGTSQDQAPSSSSNSSPQVSPLTRITRGDDGGVIVTSNPIEISSGQVIYVPIYSHIYYGNGQQYPLSATLSVRNTSLSAPILIRSVRYYDSGGKLVKEYTEGSLRLAPLATTEFFIPEQDATGGSGANFIVEWVSDQEVTTPVVEALMITTRSQQGISFVTSGHVVQELQSPN